jgi:hypothetical protein
LTDDRHASGRVILDVDGDGREHRKSALHVTLREYQHPQGGAHVYAPDAEPSLDLAVPMLHISRLDNYALPHPNLRVGPAGRRPTSSPGGTKAVNTSAMIFVTAYVPGSTLYGTGQSVALLEYDGYYASDITHYESLAKFAGGDADQRPYQRRPHHTGPRRWARCPWTLKWRFPWRRT